VDFLHGGFAGLQAVRRQKLGDAVDAADGMSRVQAVQGFNFETSSSLHYRTAPYG